MKASDVFSQSEFLLGPKVLFSEAFPDIARMEVDVICTDSSEPTYVRRYTETTAGQYVDCVNPLCYNGGFNLGVILHEMVRERETDREGTKWCQGNEGSPKGRRIYRGCGERFDYKIRLTLKPTGDDPNRAVPDA